MQAAPDSAPGTSSAATALVCDGVAVRFPRGSAWRPAGATWSAPAGSKTLLLGPSGSGKSTLALAIAGLVPEVLPANVRGDVRIDGHSLDDLSQARLRESVSIVFQDPDAQLFTETVFDEVCFALENRLLPVAEIERRAELAIEAMRLREHRDANPRHLSGGERQRVAIACALAASPRVLVLDEPTANLDPVSRAELYRTLEAMPDSSSRTVVVIEHNVDDALGFVDRVVALDARGTLLAAGPLRDVFTEHAAALADAGVWLPTGVRVRAALAGSPFASRLPAGPPLGAHELAAVFAGLHETGFAPRATAVPDARETVDGVAPEARAVRGAGAVPDADEPRGRDAVPDARGGDDRSLPGGASGAVGQAGRARAEPAVEARGLVVVRGRRT
ncbi:MAG: energy-coupling factor ABC transporter ATP-binding protein, partial [Pseudoclavibacter sp.]